MTVENLCTDFLLRGEERGSPGQTSLVQEDIVIECIKFHDSKQNAYMQQTSSLLVFRFLSTLETAVF